jgi:hypothetical protein
MSFFQRLFMGRRTGYLALQINRFSFSAAFTESINYLGENIMGLPLPPPSNSRQILCVPKHCSKEISDQKKLVLQSLPLPLFWRAQVDS